MPEFLTFKEKVFFALTKIPCGRVTTYKFLAVAIGCPAAARAVGNALNKNLHAPKVPCHRVVKSTGEVGGYVFGQKAKIALLTKEGIEIKSGKVKNFSLYLYKF